MNVSQKFIVRLLYQVFSANFVNYVREKLIKEFTGMDTKTTKKPLLLLGWSVEDENHGK